MTTAIICAFDSNNDILEMGYLVLTDTVSKYPNDTVVTLTGATILSSSDIYKYSVVESSGVYSLSPKSQEDIDTAEAAMQTSADSASHKTEVDAVLAIDASAITDVDLKNVVLMLQAQNG